MPAPVTEHPYRALTCAPPRPASAPSDAATAWTVLAIASAVQLATGAQLLIGALGLAAGGVGCAAAVRRYAARRCRRLPTNAC